MPNPRFSYSVILALSDLDKKLAERTLVVIMRHQLEYSSERGILSVHITLTKTCFAHDNDAVEMVIERVTRCYLFGWIFATTRLTAIKLPTTFQASKATFSHARASAAHTDYLHLIEI